MLNISNTLCQPHRAVIAAGLARDRSRWAPAWRDSAPTSVCAVSVPLAEEALSNVMKTRKKLTSELTEMVQLNPWFSRRFAVRYRRRMKGKRLRISERGATLRAWSHARTLLQPQIPEPWTSLLKRGVGRPLDWWSENLLTDYTNLLLETFDIVFFNCGLADQFIFSAPDSAKNNLRSFVQEGGSVYASDRAYELLRVAFPGTLDFVGDESSWGSALENG